MRVGLTSSNNSQNGEVLARNIQRVQPSRSAAEIDLFDALPIALIIMDFNVC